MNIKRAKTAGFCFGVKRAVEKVYDSLDKGKQIYTLGPIIHNETVVKELEEKGVRVLDPDRLPDLEVSEKSNVTGTNASDQEPFDAPNSLVIIRSHGVDKASHDRLLSLGCTVVDATCPFVLKIHDIVKRESRAGHPVIIVGNEGHPEVAGIKGWCSPGVRTDVISSTDEAMAYVPPEGSDEICLVAQTTFNSNKLKDILEILTEKGYNVNAVDTICSATRERQQEARQLAGEMEAASGVMIVIGSPSSSNSRKLFEICSAECRNTHFIQTLADLNLDDAKSIPCVGITAGASTPDKIIEEVYFYVRSKYGREF